MASDVINVNTGKTLSTFVSPGQDTRIPTTKSESIFTFGSFRMERTFGNDAITGNTNSINFNNFSTLNDLNASSFTQNNILSFSVQNKELNLVKADPLSYAYFGSFYSSIANSINNIINTFPYAILAYDNDIGNTILDYSAFTENLKTYSTFKIPYSSATNQGNVLINTGSSQDKTLAKDFNSFGIQLSADTGNTIFDIIDYNYIPPSGGTSYMMFKISGELFPNTTSSTFTNAVYIRPTNRVLNIYLKGFSRLETQIWINQEFLIPNATIPNKQDLRTFVWPKNIDGFNPDTFGTAFEQYQNDILNAATLVDEDKTDLMIREFFPENFIENDNQFGDMRSLAEVYAKEFDSIKQFIDGISYAHSISYNEEESVPTKFLAKLGKLFGLNLPNSFNETDIFESLVGNVEENLSYSTLNIDIWKKILTNIVWLYKRKGTRDALQFIFKLIGAPDCLINLNEFVYDIQRNGLSNYSTPDNNRDSNEVGSKINENGYINYEASNYIFQEGGDGRGNGQNYINQWMPEFEPQKRVDNRKIQTGNTDFFGTENIINTKELDVILSPASAIECDLFDWYQSSSGICWNWGTTSYTFAFSALTIPFELLPDCSTICPCVLTGMTFAQFLDYIYSSSIDPRDRKVVDQSNTSFFYIKLRNLYLYYYYSNNPYSNSLSFKKLDYFVSLLEVQFQDYLLQLIPATTIFKGLGVEYRNTIFNRQKFVYKQGINKGAEFKNKFSPPLTNSITLESLNAVINNKFTGATKIIEVKAYVPNKLKNDVIPIEVTSKFPTRLKNVMIPVKMISTIDPPHITTIPYI